MLNCIFYECIKAHDSWIVPVCLPGICACPGATISLSSPADVNAVCRPFCFHCRTFMDHCCTCLHMTRHSRRLWSYSCKQYNNIIPPEGHKCCVNICLKITLVTAFAKNSNDKQLSYSTLWPWRTFFLSATSTFRHFAILKRLSKLQKIAGTVVNRIFARVALSFYFHFANGR